MQRLGISVDGWLAELEKLEGFRRKNGEREEAATIEEISGLTGMGSRAVANMIRKAVKQGLMEVVWVERMNIIGVKRSTPAYRLKKGKSSGK